MFQIFNVSLPAVYNNSPLSLKVMAVIGIATISVEETNLNLFGS